MKNWTELVEHKLERQKNSVAKLNLEKVTVSYSEKVKQNYNKNSAYKYFFWRTKSGSEVDLVEEQNMNTIEAFEIKFSKEKSTNKKAFQTEFPHANLQVINKENYTKFL